MKLFGRKAEEEKIDGADVCLVLEGTYPFVAGGVSSWVHQIIKQMPDVSFSILHISPAADYYEEHAYELPENVIGVQEVFLHEAVSLRGSLDAVLKRKSVSTFARFLEQVRAGETSGFEELVAAFQKPSIRDANSTSLLVHRLNWPGVLEGFREEATDESFLNYFWNWYYAHQPLVNVLTARMPKAAVYHTISTGYAGVLAAAAAVHHRRPLLLTEHGIYTKERRIEIHAAEWIKDRVHEDLVVESEAPFFRRFWNRHFQTMSKICYEQADEIFTLYTGNVREQLKDGADPHKIRIIPNGISLSRFKEPAERFATRPKNKRFTVGFVGRVCPIKDVRTLVAAMRVVKDKVPDVLVRVLGPMEEDPEYADECKKLAKALDLEENIRFEGRVAVHEEMPELDVLVLTSISEAQPLVILEGGAVGLAMVATDVGSCQELLNGRTPEDRALGVAGLVTPIASPGETGRAVLELWADEGMRLQMGQSLQERVRRFYDQQDMIDAYRKIYETHMQAALPARARCGTGEEHFADERVGELVDDLAAARADEQAEVDALHFDAMRAAEQQSISHRLAESPVLADEQELVDVTAGEDYAAMRILEDAHCALYSDVSSYEGARQEFELPEAAVPEVGVPELGAREVSAIEAFYCEARDAEQANIDYRFERAPVAEPADFEPSCEARPSESAFDRCRRMEQLYCELSLGVFEIVERFDEGVQGDFENSVQDLQSQLARESTLDVEALLRFEGDLQGRGAIAEVLEEARDVALDATDAPFEILSEGLSDSDSLFDDADFELVEDLFDHFEEGAS